ncbi:FAD-binding protein, partial [Acinetobacter baumannii]
EGLDVLIVEKTPFVGGSTAVSGGAVWIPGNDQAAGLGHADTPAGAKLYLDQIVGNWASDDMKLAFLRAGPDMLRFFEANTDVKLVARA